MRPLSVLVFTVLGVGARAPAFAQNGPQRVPLDAERTIGGVVIACTGIGQEKSDPRWNAYAARVEFADTQGAFIADEALTVMDPKGRPLASVRCAGPWILLRPTASGAYAVKGWVPGSMAAPIQGEFKVPSAGQTRIYMHFPAAQ
jgi:hypothetical protein